MLTIHITRHGQPGRVSEDPSSDPEFSADDPGLSALGQDQAGMLGKRLFSENFQGNIFASPYRRTMETASIIATETGSALYPESLIQEHVGESGPGDIRALSADEIRTRFANVPADAELETPWLVEQPEEDDDITARLQRFMRTLPAQPPTGAILLVGHGAQVQAGADFFSPPADRARNIKHVPHWNCSLSTYSMDGEKITRVEQLGDTAHIPDELVTSNGSFKLARD